ncbi:DUF2877 domain-containing protein [Erysipelothrix urinaevulpis]|uniref:DUF2877 domain-containing protein n=1 Tax=Erysipelothrix urinaevulpis TaxID=2683717 RepID=UPI00135ABF99|nr:DUF2877 domain-containing protein [Erysipelothrix urinaevulpis]
MLVRVDIIPKNIIPYLSGDVPIKFHSEFKHGFNLKVEDQIIYIGGRRGSTSIYVDPHLLKRVILKNTIPNVIIADKVIHLKEWGLMIDFKHAQIEDYQVKPLGLSSQKQTVIKDIIVEKNYPTGFDVSTNVLVEQLSQHYSTSSDHFLNFVIGRGKGLTPSGDDVIIGMLFLHAMTPYLDIEFFKVLNELLAQNKTNEISQSFIREAIEGRFYQVLLDIYKANDDREIIEKRITKMLAFGSSSGKDTLAGILLGLMILEKENV